MRPRGLTVDTQKGKVENKKRIGMIDPDELASMFDVKRDIYDGGEQCRIKVVQSKADGQEYVVKVQKKKRIRGANEKLFRRTTEKLLNMPDSPHVIKVHACYEDGYYFYTLLEVLNGGDLFDFSRGGKWTTNMEAPVVEEKVRSTITETLKSLAFLHSHGMVHKDVKLENLVYKVQGDVVPRHASPSMKEQLLKDADAQSRSPAGLKLIDFDFMEQIEPDTPRSKWVVGTDGYIAPEAYKGDVGPKVDVFAAGVVMYVLIAGRYPFDDEIFDDDPSENYVGSPKLDEIYHKLQKYKVHFGRAWEHLPEAKAFCQRLLEFDVNRRPDAAEALRDPWILAGKTAKSHLSGVVDHADFIADGDSPQVWRL